MSRLRIRGLVRLQRNARERLAQGLRASEAEYFRRDVGEALRFVEGSCARHGERIADLPAPTRAAYRYLRAIDLAELPLRPDDVGCPTAPPSLRMAGLCAAVRELGDALSAALRDRPDEADVPAFGEAFGRTVSRVHRQCAELGGTPANLPAPSRRALATAAFHAQPEQLERAVGLLRGLFRAAGGPSPRTPRLSVRLESMSAYYRVSYRRGEALSRVHLGFVAAPPAVVAVLADELLRRADGRSRESWQPYTETEAFLDVAAELDALGGAARHRPAGRAHDLAELLAGLAPEDRGDATSGAPTLAWSRVPSRRQLGRYVRIIDHIEVSAALDDPRVPREIVTYILFHELLHRRIPPRWQNGRLLVHPPELRATERAYPGYAGFEAWIRRFARGR